MYKCYQPGLSEQHVSFRALGIHSGLLLAVQTGKLRPKGSALVQGHMLGCDPGLWFLFLLAVRGLKEGMPCHGRSATPILGVSHFLREGLLEVASTVESLKDRNSGKGEPRVGSAWVGTWQEGGGRPPHMSQELR